MARCGACGADNKSEARFCRRCGASLEAAAAPPSAEDERTVMIPPTDAPRPAPVRTAPPVVSTTAGADMTPIMPRGSSRGASAIDSIIPPVAPPARPAQKPAPAPASSAPGAGRQGSGLRVGLALGALALIGGGGYAAWILMRGESAPAPEPAAVAKPPAAAPAMPAQAPIPAPPAAAPPVQAPESALPPVAPTGPAEPAPSAERPTPSPPAAEPASEKPLRAQRAEKQKKRQAAAVAKRPAPKPEPQQAAAPPAPETRPAAPAPAPPPDPQAAHWAKMQEELSACGTFNVFCKEQVRWKYCSGHWGKVPQCPQGSR